MSVGLMREWKIVPAKTPYLELEAQLNEIEREGVWNVVQVIATSGAAFVALSRNKERATDEP